MSDLVACMGAGFANHVELSFVPENLVTRIHDNKLEKQAAFTTVGNVTVHGVRHTNIHEKLVMDFPRENHQPFQITVWNFVVGFWLVGVGKCRYFYIMGHLTNSRWY